MASKPKRYSEWNSKISNTLNNKLEYAALYLDSKVWLKI